MKKLISRGDGSRKTTLQKQAILAVILLAVAAAGFLVYFLAIKGKGGSSLPELLEGESYDEGLSSVLMCPKYERKDIKTIEINNEYGHTVYNSYDGEYSDGSTAKSFEIEGNEHIRMSAQNVAELVVNTGRLTTVMPTSGQYRVTQEATLEDLAQYGFDGESSEVWFKVTLESGESYKVFLGNSAVTRNGYYAIFEGRRNSVDDGNGNVNEYYIVYILSPDPSKAVLNDSCYYVDPIISEYYGNEISALSNYRVYRDVDGARTLIVEAGPVKISGVTASNLSYELYYPSVYMMNEDGFSDAVISNIAYFTATSIVAYGKEVYDESVYTSYGLDLNEERLEKGTDKNHALLVYRCDGFENATVLYFSESFTDIDGKEYYYVFSHQCNVIAKVSTETSAYVDWPIARYTSGVLYYEYLSSCNMLDFVSESEGFNFRFSLSGTERNFHVDVTTAGENGKTVYKRSDGKFVYVAEDGRLFCFTGTDKYYYFGKDAGREYVKYLSEDIYRVEDEDGNVYFKTASVPEMSLSALTSNTGISPLVYDAKYKVNSSGTVSYTEFYGEFEEFRSLYYVLITRSLVVAEDAIKYKDSLASEPVKTISARTTQKDQPISYIKYDSRGNKVTDSAGRVVEVRYSGGYIACSDIVVSTTVDGKPLEKTYPVAFYDEKAGRFFLKEIDKNDGYDKPTNYKYDSGNNLLVSTYLPKNTTGKYVSTEYSYEFYNIIEEYTNIDGKVIKQINQTYYYLVTSRTDYTYLIEADGSRTLVDTETEKAELGVLIRIPTMDKLSDDIVRFFKGEEIDKFGLS